MKNTQNIYYDENYFKWQARIGEFGGWANYEKFINYISPSNIVLDFGCGGGYLLKNINCREKIGIEINPQAIKIAKDNGIKVFNDINELNDNYVDVIISNNALEHTLYPLTELKILYKKLKHNGKIIFIVPCESILMSYKPNDINHHLYSWSPMSIGNLFTEAGFYVIDSKPYFHKWPPKYLMIAKLGGRKIFNLASYIFGRIMINWTQIIITAEKRND